MQECPPVKHGEVQGSSKDVMTLSKEVFLIVSQCQHLVESSVSGFISLQQCLIYLLYCTPLFHIYCIIFPNVLFYIFLFIQVWFQKRKADLNLTSLHLPGFWAAHWNSLQLQKLEWPWCYSFWHQCWTNLWLSRCWGNSIRSFTHTCT